MNNLQKQFLFWTGFVILVIFGLFLLVSVNQKVNTATTTNTVSFNGEGKVVAKPDIAAANIAIVTQGSSSKDAQNNNAKKSQAIIDFLKTQNIDEKDIKTIGYNIQPLYRYPQYGGTPTIIGYEVQQTTEVKVRNLDNVSKVLDGVVSAGANRVDGLSFQIDNPEKLRADAREKAIQDAKEKAKVLENQIGVRLGKIINFTENINGYPTPMYDVAMKSGYGMGGGASQPAISTGENEITVDVSITYQIK